VRRILQDETSMGSISSSRLMARWRRVRRQARAPSRSAHGNDAAARLDHRDAAPGNRRGRTTWAQIATRRWGAVPELVDGEGSRSRRPTQPDSARLATLHDSNPAGSNPALSAEIFRGIRGFLPPGAEAGRTTSGAGRRGDRWLRSRRRSSGSTVPPHGAARAASARAARVKAGRVLSQR
jgi:hypothetical protein